MCAVTEAKKLSSIQHNICHSQPCTYVFRTEDSFSNADHLYSIFDPDSNSVTVDENYGSRTLENLQTLKTDLDTLLDMAGFQPVPQDHITISQKAGHLRGFNVQHPPSDALRIQLFYQRLNPIIVRHLRLQNLVASLEGKLIPGHSSKDSRSHCACCVLVPTQQLLTHVHLTPPSQAQSSDRDASTIPDVDHESMDAAMIT